MLPNKVLNSCISFWPNDLPNLENKGNKINYEEIRAIADSKSLNLRFSNKKIVKISPLGINHKLLLNSTKKGVKPLEIILDDLKFIKSKEFT